jgi:hypothetical protein
MSPNIPIAVLSAVLLLAPGLASAAGPGGAEASSESASPWRAGVPSLGETRFIPNTLLDDPFIRTSLRTKLGYGRANKLRLRLIEIGDGPVPGLEGDLIYALLSFRYQHAVRDWLAVWMEANMAARLGNGLQSLLAQGVTVRDGFEVGWLFRTWRTDRHLMSASLSLSNSSSTVVDLYTFVQRVVDEGEIAPDNRLVKDVSMLSAALELRYAYTAGDMVGLQAAGRAIYGETVNYYSVNEWHYALGAAVHLDILDRTGLPLGFVLGYRYNSLPDPGDGSRTNSQTALFNVSFTGRRDFSVGFDIRYERVPLARFEEDADFLSGLVSMWYYF